MNNFIFENKTKVYFGKGGVKEYLGSLLVNYGETVMLAYGGGSIKRNGVYDEIMGILNAAGKRVVEFDRYHVQPHLCQGAGGRKAGAGESCGPYPRRGRRQRVRLLQGHLRAGQTGRGHLGTGEHQAHIPNGVYPPRHHRHGVRYRQRDEQRGRHHPRGKENQGRPLGRTGGFCLPRPQLHAVRSHEAGYLRCL